MGRWIFWGIAILVLAVTTHLAVVLFTPGASMASVVGRVFAVTTVNSLAILDRDQVVTLVREPNPDLVYAVCPYDVSGTPLSIEAEIPETYWSISVYSERGDNVYTLNDAQAGVSAISIQLEQEKPAVLDLDEDIIPLAAIGNTVIVSTPTARGIVMIRAFVPDRAHRGVVLASLKSSTCRPKIS